MHRSVAVSQSSRSTGRTLEGVLPRERLDRPHTLQHLGHERDTPIARGHEPILRSGERARRQVVGRHEDDVDADPDERRRAEQAPEEVGADDELDRRIDDRVCNRSAHASNSLHAHAQVAKSLIRSTSTENRFSTAPRELSDDSPVSCAAVGGGGAAARLTVARFGGAVPAALMPLASMSGSVSVSRALFGPADVFRPGRGGLGCFAGLVGPGGGAGVSGPVVARGAIVASLRRSVLSKTSVLSCVRILGANSELEM